MEKIEDRTAVKRNFDFVDTIRCISMIGIVYEHSTVLDSFNYVSVYTGLLQSSVLQLYKFSTIAFFLIAGFLINHKFNEYTPLQYLGNRFRNTIWPWAFWMHILIIANIINVWVKGHKHNKGMLFPDGFISFLENEYYTIIFRSSFWFILNFLICISILLLFKRYIYKIWFGIILGLTSLFYSVNLYYAWITTEHTTAIFGFVFFLWLGVYMNRHFNVIGDFIKRISWIWFIAVTIFFFFMADLEILYLKSIGVEDAYNTLRITNILYSLACFMVLLKIGSISFINNKLEPRKTTYGIYLIHLIIMTTAVTELFRPFHLHPEAMTIGQLIIYSLVRLIATYGLTMLVVKGILMTRLKGFIGA